ncbi:MCE family protein MceB [Nocardia nova SH22a]|uniref:MCE family protein MceB n=1 Tax=Nocardia nova SH22a TaxID=1415166 RepID=W5TEV1_9NOCA|nr:MlaD family protein [Nocardia nova]AHH17762.1 MCE family protein MceB [Nocardia nova SH22a]
MTYRRSLFGLSVFLVVAMALLWVTFTTLDRGVDGATHKYSAIFSDVSGLRAGDDVRMAGVRVGRVDEIDLDGVQARVTFRVQADQRLFGTTKAAITYQNVVGQRYLGLAPSDSGDPAPLRPGAVIPLDHTEPSFDLSALLNGFEPLFGGLDTEQVNNLTAALIRALQGDQGSLAALVARTAALAQAVAGPDQVLGAIIDNLGAVVTGLASHSQNLQTVLTQAHTLIDGLARHRDELTGTLDSVATLTGRVGAVMDTAQPQLDEMLHRTPGFTAHVNADKDAFAYLGYNLPPMFQGLARTTQEGAYLDIYPCTFDVTLVPALSTVVSTIVAAATPSGTVQHSAMCR